MSIDDTIFEVGEEIERHAPTAKQNWDDLCAYIAYMEKSHEVLMAENIAMKKVIQIISNPNPAIASDLRTHTEIPEHHRPPGEPDLGDRG